MPRLPVETERTKARAVATLTAHPGADIPNELQFLRSWVLTRGIGPVGRGSWTLTDDDFQVRHDIDREDIATETVPQERAWLQLIPSAYIARVDVPKELQADLPRVAAALKDWAVRNGYEVDGPAEVFLPTGPDETAMRLTLPIGRPEHQDWIDL
jgi:hypothetical protein